MQNVTPVQCTDRADKLQMVSNQLPKGALLKQKTAHAISMNNDLVILLKNFILSIHFFIISIPYKGRKINILQFE